MGDAPSPSVLYCDPKKTTENFARLCHFLVTICGDVMRDILSHYIKPANLRPELDKNRSKLDKITNAQEKDILYPPHSSTSVPQIRSRDLDISLLYKILRNICNIPTHIAGWGKQPVQGDFSLAACIERIRILRNSISGHSANGTVDDQEFEDYWRELRRSVVETEREEIGSDKYERGIDHLHDCDLNPTKSKEYVAQIRRNTGEIIMKRERIDLVEEEASAKRVRLANLEERQGNLEIRNAEFTANLEAKLTESLTAFKSDMLKEWKATELRIQQKKDASLNSLPNADSETSYRDTSTDTTIKTTTTTIEFKAGILRKRQVFQFPMHSTTENKCWMMVPESQFAHTRAVSLDTAVSSRLYLLSDIDVIKEIKIPKEYDVRLFSTNITTNEDGQVVFISGRSLVAARMDGEFQKLFDICKDYEFTSFSVFCMRSGSYFIRGQRSAHFREYNGEGVFLRKWNLLASFIPYTLRLNQNDNDDFVLTSHSPFSVTDHFGIFDESFNLKCTVDIDLQGIIIPLLNKNGDLLYGHGQSIDLLDSGGKFIKTVYKTHRRDIILNIAHSKNDTMWILYDSFQIDIFKLEIAR